MDVAFSTLIINDSIVQKSVALGSGAVTSFASYISMTNTTFNNNTIGGNVQDISILDKTNPGSGGTFIRCDKGSPVNLCNGLNGISVASDQKANTNCNVDAISDPASNLCGL
jgi:hypothetical protein